MARVRSTTEYPLHGASCLGNLGRVRGTSDVTDFYLWRNLVVHGGVWECKDGCADGEFKCMGKSKGYVGSGFHAERVSYSLRYIQKYSIRRGRGSQQSP